MRKGSGKKKYSDYKIDSKQKEAIARVVAPVATPEPTTLAAVNLRYFQKSRECFSTWQAKELKAFSGFVEKMAGKTESQVTAITQTCHSHNGATSKQLPASVSKDVRMYSLDVGPKSRVHGFFFSGTFFLVWIDREGKILGH